MDQDLSFRKVSVLPTVALLILSRIIERDTLLLALLGTTERVRERFRRMMPERAWLRVMDDLEGFGPVRLVDVEAAQQEIARYATQLVEDGIVSLDPVQEPAYPADEFIWLLRANDNLGPETDDADEVTDDLASEWAQRTDDLEGEWARLVSGDHDDQGDEGDDYVDDLPYVDDLSMAEILADIRRVLEMEEPNCESADRIRALMVTFDDLSRLDHAGIQTLLHRVEKNQLAMALTGASEDIKELFFLNMSERAGKVMREDMDFMGAVRLCDVEEAQITIVSVAKDLANSGEIVISSGDEDDNKHTTRVLNRDEVDALLGDDDEDGE